MNIPGDPFSRKRPSLSAFLCTPARAINQRTGAAGQLRLHRKLARVSAFHPIRPVHPFAVKGRFGAPAISEPHQRLPHDPPRTVRACFKVKLGC